MSTAQQTGGAEKILQVAMGFFAQKGYEATSTREIVEAAGVTKPMLYYYFGSKEGLCKAAIKHCVQPFFADSARWRRMPGTAGLAGGFRLEEPPALQRPPRRIPFLHESLLRARSRKFLEDFESLGEEVRACFGI